MYAPQVNNSMEEKNDFWDYLGIIWESTFPTYLKKLITLQNKAVKFICAAKFCDSSSPYYKCLKIIKLIDLYKLEVGKLISSQF